MATAKNLNDLIKATSVYYYPLDLIVLDFRMYVFDSITDFEENFNANHAILTIHQKLGWYGLGNVYIKA